MKAHHQHTVVTLVEDTGKAHDIVGHAPKEPGTLGEQSAVDVAAVPVPILYYDLVSPGGEEAAGRGGGLQSHFPGHRRITTVG